MLTRRLIRSHDARRLRALLLALFIALALPTAVLIWQAYKQLRWEAFHHYRTIAEELAGRIDAELLERMRTVDARSFADYAFLIVTGDPSANLVQRSPLASLPVQQDVPGVIGYFQVDAQGIFSTPILPPENADARSLGIGAAEYTARLQLAREIQQVLADNRLVRPRAETDAHDTVAGTALPRERVAAVPQVERQDYGQQAFDDLNLSAAKSAELRQSGAPERRMVEPAAQSRRPGEVTNHRTDAAPTPASAPPERMDTDEESGAAALSAAGGRSRRKEQIALPEPVSAVASESGTGSGGPTALRISTFESEIDAFEFSLLDSGHFVLFRRVWRDDERYIQGLLVDAKTFMDEVVGARFADTALAGMSHLVVTYDDAVLRSFDGGDAERYPGVAGDLDGTLLYRNRLPAPMSSLQLVFGIEHLPPGPGARVLGWATLVLALMFIIGFATLHRLGVGQIELARQEQDFVSAVSHELRTPLTSIRMYGEMLREGWVAEDQRQKYYEFIHEESERLSRLISNVLQLARITRGDPQLDRHPVQLGELLHGVESKIAAQVDRAGFDLTVQVIGDAEQAVIDVDADCVAQILINLVDNAIKFSRNAAVRRIEIVGRRLAGGRVSISVRDHGPGVPKDQMKKVFRLFYRSGSELTRETAGTGIGLAIVRELALAMGGNVELVNAEPGAEFRINFPVVGPAP